MRPPRDDIAIPELPPNTTWVGAQPGSMTRLAAAGPVLVHVFDFAQLNSVRTLPYVERWHRRYHEAGLNVVGVQAPRFPFGSEPDAVSEGLRRLGVSFPTAIDSEREIWRAYGCEGWPSLFLWGRGGALRWFHFGEGAYGASEQAIHEELREADGIVALPPPIEPLRPTDGPGIEVIAPTPELLPVQGEPWTLDDGPGFVVEYEAGGAAITAEGEGELELELDGRRLTSVSVDGPGLYQLVEHADHGRHRLAIDLRGSVGVWSVSYLPGLPAAMSQVRRSG